MALPNFKKAIYRLLFRSRPHPNISGFTLLELLVAALVAGLVVSGLLYIIVELLQIDRREAVLDQTQRDMQRALDYIADDLREAVHIYDTPSIISTQLTDLPISSEAILAFWRPNPVENLPDCDAAPISANATLQAECQTLEVRQSAYSLVVYLQKERNLADNPNWTGKSRIIRYELDKYSDLDSLTKTVGYEDPAIYGFDFDGWVASGASTAGTASVLVDFVDDPDETYAQSPLSDGCTSLGADYTILPNAATTNANTSFFGCLRDSGGNSNQYIYLFLRGNIDGAGGAAFSESSALPVLETRVLMRGVLNKNPG